MSIRLIIIAALCSIPMVAFAQAPPNINPNAIYTVRMTAGAPQVGAGVVIAPGAAADGSVQVSLPSGADGKASCVVYRTAPSDTTTGLCVQLGQSNMQVLIGSAGVTINDPLNIADGTGAWQTAPLGSANTYLIALRSCAANSLCWAGPHHGRPTVVSNPATGSATGSTGGPTKNDSTPSVIPEMTVSITTSGGRVICDFNGAFSFGLGFSGFAAIFLDGTEVTGSRRPLSNSLTLLGLSGAFSLPIPLRAWGTPAAGAHTITVQWAATAGTITAVSTQRSLVCEERML